MTQFNLLPDVKIEYIKAKQLKRSLLTVALLVAASSVTVAVLLYLGVGVVQKNHLNDLSKDLRTTAAKLRNTPDIDKIITIQNQLTSLPMLHADKPAASRVFNYLSQITPATITITSATVDFTGSTMTISGNAKDLLAVNTFVDTLKFTNYTKKTTDPSAATATVVLPTDVSPVKAFSKVLLTGFSTGDKNATYQVAFSYDPEIFKNQNTVSLAVPNTITTRSQVDQPKALFEAPPAPTPAVKETTR